MCGSSVQCHLHKLIKHFNEKVNCCACLTCLRDELQAHGSISGAPGTPGRESLSGLERRNDQNGPVAQNNADERAEKVTNE